MRVWDLPPSILCRQHLLGQHREIHAIWSILVNDRWGYRNHPEVRRWEGRLSSLWWRHFRTAIEMRRRGYKHNSTLPAAGVFGSGVPQRAFINTVAEQKVLLKAKGCDCKINLVEERKEP